MSDKLLDEVNDRDYGDWIVSQFKEIFKTLGEDYEKEPITSDNMPF